MERLYQLAKGYSNRYPEGYEPYQIVTRILEECGEVASEVNHFEGSGIKVQKHGEPSRQDMADEIKDAIKALMQLVTYYEIEDEFEECINKNLEGLKRTGHL